MKRKAIVSLIAVVAVIAVAMFAGCVEEEEPTPTPMPTTPAYTPEPTVSNIYASDETAMRKIRTALTNHGLHSVHTQVADGRDKGGVKVLILNYRSEDDFGYETEAIIGAYVGIVEIGGDFDELAVVVGDRSDNAIGMWYCKKDWANKHINGKLSSDALLSKVLSTITTFNQ
jgi:hypothetical protein